MERESVDGCGITVRKLFSSFEYVTNCRFVILNFPGFCMLRMFLCRTHTELCWLVCCLSWGRMLLLDRFWLGISGVLCNSVHGPTGLRWNGSLWDGSLLLSDRCQLGITGEVRCTVLSTMYHHNFFNSGQMSC